MITTLDELEDILWEELMSILGYEIDNPAWSINPPVRRSWQQQGQPGWSINDDILFFKIFDESGQDITIPVDTIINNDLEYLKVLLAERYSVLKEVFKGKNVYISKEVEFINTTIGPTSEIGRSWRNNITTINWKLVKKVSKMTKK